MLDRHGGRDAEEEGVREGVLHAFRHVVQLALEPILSISFGPKRFGEFLKFLSYEQKFKNNDSEYLPIRLF
jgi:hypothetical protein